MFKRRQLRQKYIAVFDTPTGREVLQHLMKACHMRSSTFVSGDQYLTAYREGQRSVVISLLNMLNIDETKFIEEMEKTYGPEQPE